jgi:hypothetical protein
MTTPLTKLIADNKWNPIEENPKEAEKTHYLLLSDDDCIDKGFWDGERWNTETLFIYPTHFRPLPDDRLALVTEVLLEALNNLVSKSDDYTPVPLAILIENGRRAIQQATTIAEGKDNAM